MPFSIVRDDISRVHADVLVNAANVRLAPGGGVCGALFSAAGFDEMRAACEAIGGCATGDAVATPAFNLPARWCVHAVGPIWRGGRAHEEELLRRCYRSAFARAVELGARSVAFPLISAGIYGFPVERALAIAREEVAAFLRHHDEVALTLVVFERAVVQMGNALVEQVQEYIDDEYVDSSSFMRRDMGELERELQWTEDASAPLSVEMAEPVALPECLQEDDASIAAPRPFVAANIRMPGAAMPGAPSRAGATLDAEIAQLVATLDAPFSTTLLALIDARGMTDAEVYHRANISRQLFSKIRGNESYRPSKQTVVALAIALELDMSATQDLLARAGFTLSKSSKFDVIVRFFIERGIYDLFQLNEVLFAYDLPLVGSV
ncbi:macro domain-containing protein [Enorma massiliensis]|uniref:macro domain-containing protein n=1 Tax=Enorma massiliensis TaxID=1472761 RepID=UPI00195958DF|nr:macro domain-containing protein [Enorma massiliensis]MBM6783027.1 macro domain-containing protein [Enorma massiliensis]